MNERISALVDDELDELDQRRVLDAVKSDAELRRTWERYHLIRAAMKHQLSILVSPGLPERICAQLDAGSERTATSLRFWPLVGGFAAAASIAVVSIVAVQTLRAPTTPVAVTPAAVAMNAETPVPTTTLVSSDKPAVVAPVETAAAPATTPEDRLHYYLVGHNEFMPTASMGNMLPYVRVMADDQDK